MTEKSAINNAVTVEELKLAEVEPSHGGLDQSQINSGSTVKPSFQDGDASVRVNVGDATGLDLSDEAFNSASYELQDDVLIIRNADGGEILIEDLTSSGGDELFIFLPNGKVVLANAFLNALSPGSAEIELPTKPQDGGGAGFGNYEQDTVSIDPFAERSLEQTAQSPSSGDLSTVSSATADEDTDEEDDDLSLLSSDFENSVPTLDAADDEANVSESGSVNIDLLTNDTASGGAPLEIESVDDSGLTGKLTVNTDGSVTYDTNGAFEDLAEGETAEDSFTYTISDGRGGTDTATVTVNVTGENNDPVAVQDFLRVTQNNAITVNPRALFGDDTDVDGDTLTVSRVFDPVNGTVTLNDDGSITFTPDADFVGRANYQYEVSDGNGGFDTATVNVGVVAPEEKTLEAVDDVLTANEDTPLSFTGSELTGNDAGPGDDSLSVTSVGEAGRGTVAIADDGTITYDPNGAFEDLAEGETAEDSFTYTISDGRGGTDTATVTVNVTGENDDPVAVQDFLRVTQNNAITVNPRALFGDDTDVDGDTLTVSRVFDPVNGTVTLNDDGSITFTPDVDFIGRANYQYEVSDGNGGFDTATVNVGVVAPEEKTLEAVDDVLTANEDTPLSFTGSELTGNDTGLDGDSLSVTSVGEAGRGTVAIADDGTITYDPNGAFEDLAEGETAEDSFTYTISDGRGGTDTATVTVNVTGENDDPVAVRDFGRIAKNGSLTINPRALFGDDTDVDGDTLTVSRVFDPVNGTVTLNDDGSITFTPDADFVGTASYQYEVSDGNGGFDTASVNVGVVAPEANDDVLTTDEDTPLSFAGSELTGNDTGLDGDSLSVTSVGEAGRGTVAIADDGTITYDPNGAFEDLDEGETAEDSFTYTVSDQRGGTDTATVTVTITGENDDPVYTGDLGGGGTASGSVSAAAKFDQPDPTLNDFWLFTAEAGDIISFSVNREESDFDPAIWIFRGRVDDPAMRFGDVIDSGDEGFVAFSNDVDEHEGPFADPSGSFVVPESGEYTAIVVNLNSGPDSGGDGLFDYSINIA